MENTEIQHSDNTEMKQARSLTQMVHKNVKRCQIAIACLQYSGIACYAFFLQWFRFKFALASFKVEFIPIIEPKALANTNDFNLFYRYQIENGFWPLLTLPDRS